MGEVTRYMVHTQRPDTYENLIALDMEDVTRFTLHKNGYTLHSINRFRSTY